MSKFACLTFAFFLMVTAAPSAFAQIDRAAASPYSDFKNYYDKMMRSASEKKRDAALKESLDMGKALNAMYEFSKDIPRTLNDNNLRELGSQAEKFLRAINDFRDKSVRLANKLKRVGEEYDSERSDVKRAYETLIKTFNELHSNFKKIGKDIGNKYKAIKATCMRGCLP